MKRLLCILLSFSICCALSACNPDSQHMGNPVNFYYRADDISFDSPQGVIIVEVRDAKSNSNDYQYLIEQYLNGPRTGGRISPFPAGTTLKEFNLNETSAQIILSPHITMLTDAELMIACVCLARTLFDLTGVQSVQIGAHNNLLNGEQYVTITTDNYEIWNSEFTTAPTVNNQSE